MMARLSKRLLLVNLVLAAVAVVLAVSLVRDLSRSRPIPAPPAARRTQAAVAKDGGEPASDDKLGDYNVIVAKHLFNPSRSEGGPVAATAAAPPPPKPMLLGVIVDGPKSRAYLEDASTKRVFGYQVGDSVSGGRLDKITEDKVVIVRPDGVIDVLLRDPSKPKPAPVAAGAQAPHPPTARAGNPAGQPPVMPRANRRLPAEPAPAVQNPPIPQAPPSPQPPPAAEAEQ